MRTPGLGTWLSLLPMFPALPLTPPLKVIGEGANQRWGCVTSLDPGLAAVSLLPPRGGMVRDRLNVRGGFATAPYKGIIQVWRANSRAQLF